MTPQQPVLDVELQPKQTALQGSVDVPAELALARDLAKDPTIDVGKLKEIIGLGRSLRADQAKAEFWAAFAAMQEKLPVISKKGEILDRSGKVQSKFSRYEDIQRIVKPILREFGFTVSHKQTPDTAKEMVIVTDLVHRGGHVESSTFKADSDNTGSKNNVQGLGSVASYGKRYNVTALLDLEESGLDNDAQDAQKPIKDAPAGFEDWWDNLVAVADEGTAKLLETWKASKAEYRDHVFAANRKGWEAVKGKAAKATKDARARENSRG